MIEEQLLDRINSGTCFALVGSGPSCEMGYPSWSALAAHVANTVRLKLGEKGSDAYEKLLRQDRYADLFERASRDIGRQAVEAEVRAVLRPSPHGHDRIYSLLAKWPFAGYLTTNFDDELQTHLARENVYCRRLSNLPEDVRQITASERDFVAKLHGDFDAGRLILTSTDYSDIRSHAHMEYLRERLGSILTMFPVCIIGYSLRDPDVELILEKAKQFCSPKNPLHMMAADVDAREAESFFDRYNIRVISYKNPDGSHRQLRRILSTYDGHIVPRESVRFDPRPRDEEEARTAASMFIFTQMQLRGESEDFTLDAAISALLPALRASPAGVRPTGEDLAGASPATSSFWLGVSEGQTDGILQKVLTNGWASLEGGTLRISEKGAAVLDEGDKQREVLLDGFRQQASMDFRKEFPSAADEEAARFSEVLNSALVEAFRTRGLEIAQFIASLTPVRVADASDLFRSFKEHSAALTGQDVRYYLIRYATEVVTRPNLLQRRYLWHLSQGYFAYHALRLDPRCQFFRRDLLSASIWVLDSSVIIPLLAKGCLNHRYTLDLFTRIRDLGLPAVVLAGIAEEVEDHARWARDFVAKRGEESPEFLKAAIARIGARQNLFIDGYIQSRAEGACLNFRQYMSDAFGGREYYKAIVSELDRFNVKTLQIREWPGFEQADWGQVEDYRDQIAALRREAGTYRDDDQCRVEAEVLTALANESTGRYNIRGPEHQEGGAYFVSHSGVLNLAQRPSGLKEKLAWKPEAFYRFLLCFPVIAPSQDWLQECMLGELLTGGVQIINEARYSRYFGAAIRQSRLTLKEVSQHYHATVRDEFADDVEGAFEKLPDLEKPFFPLQLAERAIRAAAYETQALRQKARMTERERKELEFLRRKYAKKAKKRGKTRRKQ